MRPLHPAPLGPGLPGGATPLALPALASSLPATPPRSPPPLSRPLTSHMRCVSRLSKPQAVLASNPNEDPGFGPEMLDTWARGFYAELARTQRSTTRTFTHSDIHSRRSVYPRVSGALRSLRRARGLFSFPSHRQDYVGECRNCERFAETSAELGFSVVSQEPISELCSRRVFVSRWLDGTPLRQCDPQQAKEMVRVGIRAYVTQMLHTGLLHADPHPGNLMLLRDGRLAILDFGSVTTIPQDMRIGMINLSGHAMHRDWEAVAADVVVRYSAPGQPQPPVPPAPSSLSSHPLAFALLKATPRAALWVREPID